ncbi:MAG TPA: signal peptidase II [Gemmatimonadaceae bacterium]|nr:signal peptidase II [Gemmatimonadaceae bacterium]
MSGANRNGRLFWSAAVVVVILDVVTKWLAVNTLDLHLPRRVIGNVVRLTLAYNPGAAFSMSLGSMSRYIFGAFAVIALVILWRLYRTAAPVERLKVFALGLAWGGAAGNLIDRFRTPYLGVVDFIDIGVGNVRFWTFNVADSAVTIGAITLGWVLLQEDRQRAVGSSELGAENGTATSPDSDLATPNAPGE